MGKYSDEFVTILEELDVAAARKLWAAELPYLDQPKTDDDALVQLHATRTGAFRVSLRARAFSHRWLLERGWPSLLPDHLRPRAERLYPRVAEAVGIAVGFSSPLLKPIVQPLLRVMETSVLETLGDGVTDPVVIKERMLAAKDRELRKLL